MKQFLSGADWIVSHYLPDEVNASLNHILQITKGELYGGCYIPATVPGDVQSDALEASLIGDINYGYNALNAEWTYQRDWLYVKRFIPVDEQYRRIRLCFDGVDYSCEVYLNGSWLGNHENAWIPFEFDITDKILRDQENCLIVLVKAAPEAEGQWGRTSAVRHLKARFAYGWDWCTRLVPLGIWKDVYLRYDKEASIEDVHVTTEVDYFQRRANICVTTTLSGKEFGYSAFVTLRHPCGFLQTLSVPVENSISCAEFVVEKAELWYPNDSGNQPLYKIQVSVGDMWDEYHVNIGLRHIEWKRTEGAVEDALTYQPYVNGLRIYLQGYNFTPIRQLYGRSNEEAYKKRIELAKEVGANFLRVWGGGLLEREIFYDLCDRAGILVMQELLQSSATRNNHPPRDEAYINMLVETAESAVKQKRNHTCLIVWCGGNELSIRGDYMDVKGNIYIEDVEGMEGYLYDVADHHWVPLDSEYPTLAAIREVVKRLDPGRMWFPTSGSGPITQNANLDFVGGKMHDVHGPWEVLGPTEFYTWYNALDMMLHAEFGCPGAASVQTLEKILPQKYLWPLDETNPMVHYHGRMWAMTMKQLHPFFGIFKNYYEFTLASRFVQWEQLRYALEAHRRLGKRCAGAWLWHMGEPWPNVSDNSSIDVFDQVKPAFYGEKAAFRALHIAAHYDSVIHKEAFKAEISLYNSTASVFTGTIAARLYALDGTLLDEIQADCKAEADSVVSKALELHFTNLPDGLFFLRQTLLDKSGCVLESGYSVHSTHDIPYAALLSQPICCIETMVEGRRLRLKNVGSYVVSALTVECENESSLIFSDGCLMLLPGEETYLELKNRSNVLGDLFISGFGVPYRKLDL